MVKNISHSLLTSWLLLALTLSNLHAQPSLQLEARSNGWDLVVGSLSSTGALFLQQASDLPTLAGGPAVMLQTNTPLTKALRLPVPAVGSSPNRAFFSALFWPGRSVGEFGDPEYAVDPPPPAMILITQGVPSSLANQQTLTAEFFVTDTTGQPLATNASATVLVLRGIDGEPHPDAYVTPAGGSLTNGYLRLTLTIYAATPLDGYTLGLRLVFPGAAPAKAATTAQLQALVLDNSIACQPGQTPKACLDDWRLANADGTPSWGYPLAGSGHLVSGTFGEWRGENNTSVHRGLDLAAVPNTRVYPSRSGVVSFVGLVSQDKPCYGHCVVVDHGDGWFSLYLHLDKASVGVKVGQAVTAGVTTLATKLYTSDCIGGHLHFELQRDSNTAHWWERNPGSRQDPLQISTINPGSTLFGVPGGSRPPQPRRPGAGLGAGRW